MDDKIHTNWINKKLLLSVITVMLFSIGLISRATIPTQNPLFQHDKVMVIPTNQSYLTIRKGPGFTYPIIASVDSINALTVVEKGIWYKVSYNDFYGYVYCNTFLDEEAYEPNRLKGFRIGLDPDGQKILDTQSEFLAPQSKILTERMIERHTGLYSGKFDYDINLIIANKLKLALEEEGAEVFITRDNSDVSISNRERAEFLNKYNCDVILSISCQSSDNPLDSGASVYIPRFSSGNNTAKLADIIVSNLSLEVDVKDSSVNVANNVTFLNWAKGTALKVELGYLSNRADEKRLTNDDYQQAIAKALKNSIVDILINEETN